jgi:hypothetical protein
MAKLCGWRNIHCIGNGETYKCWCSLQTAKDDLQPQQSPFRIVPLGSAFW